METSENRILKQKLIIRDKTIERLKDELIEVNKLNLLLEKEMNDKGKHCRDHCCISCASYPISRDKYPIKYKIQHHTNNINQRNYTSLIGKG